MDQNNSLTDKTLSRREYWTFILFVTVLATIVTAWFTWPLLNHFNTHIPGRGGDALEYLWGVWWFEEALINRGQSPSYLNIIFYPTSLKQPILSATFWARIVSIPFTSWVGPVFAYNSHLFISFVLTWLFMSLLCLELTGNRKAALIGGAIFTYFINRTLHIFYGHWTIALIYPVPLLILTFWRLVKRPSIIRALAFGGVLIISATIDLPLLAQLTFPVLTAVLIFFFITQRKQMLSWHLLKYLAFGFGLATIFLLPVMWPLIQGAFSNNLDWYQAVGVATFSTDLFAPFVPPPGHPLTEIWSGLRELSEKIYAFDGSITESVVYIGWLTILLAGLGAAHYWHRSRDVRLWLIIALFLSLLALGPILRVGGEIVKLVNKPIIFPYYILMKTPLFSWGRAPARFYFAVMFALTILAAYGVKYLLSQAPIKNWSTAVTAVIMALILYDSTFFSKWPLMDLTIPPFYTELATDVRSVAVLDIPILDYQATQHQLLYQMTHKHALVGGNSYRIPPEVVQKMKEIESFAKPGGNTAQLASEGVSYIVLHRRYLLPAELDDLTDYLIRELGAPIYQDDQIIAFFVPDSLEIAPPPFLMTK